MIGNPTKLDGLEAYHYSVRCEGDHLEEPAISRAIFLKIQNDKGETAFAIESDGVTELVKCSGVQEAATDAESSQQQSSCLDNESEARVSLEGLLDHQIFPGSPNFDDVTKGDLPEPAYILHLDRPICVTKELGDVTDIKTVHLYVADGDQQQSVWSTLHTLIGKKVIVTGEAPFPSHTGHHHAPAVMAINDAKRQPEPGSFFGTAATTVQAFYMALSVGDGEEASALVIPDKRMNGPLSRKEITGFFRNLKVPLRLIDLTPLSESEFTVLYTYETAAGLVCNGEANVRTINQQGRNLISTIATRNGC